MVVLAYAYTNLIYSVLMSTVKPNLPKNLHELLKLDEIKVYTFQHPDDGEYMNGIEDLLQIVVHFEAWGNKIVEPVNSTNDFAVFDKTVLSLAYHGVVGAKAISPKFIAIQNFGNMRTFTALLEETGRFVIVRNDDFHVLDFKSLWISTRCIVGQVFGNYLKRLYESGTYSFWSRQWDKYVDASGVRAIRKGNKKYNGHSSKKNEPLSYVQLVIQFTLLEIGLATACLGHVLEIGWFLSWTIFENI